MILCNIKCTLTFYDLYYIMKICSKARTFMIIELIILTLLCDSIIVAIIIYSYQACTYVRSLILYLL